jgi:sugar transferase (PEP-CTERM/EpsH1 system associated)
VWFLIAGPPTLIAHVIHRLDYGGLENGLVNLVNNLPAERFRHAIVCLAGSTDFRRRIRRDDVPVLSIDKREGKDPRAYQRMWQTLRRLAPDVVHTRNLGTVDMQWVAWLAGVRYRVHGEHGWEAADPNGRNARHLTIRRACRPVVQRYVAMSRDLATWLERAVGVPATRVRQVYSGVDAGTFCPDGPAPVDLPWPGARADSQQMAASGLGCVTIGTVGRLDPVKNHAALIDAFAAILERNPAYRSRLRLIIAGGGPLQAELADAVRHRQLGSTVWLAGVRADVARLMRAIDVFVLPSLNEGISNTILEAMATGRPVVAARVGGNPELVVEGTTGRLYEPGKPRELEQAVLSYLDDPVLRRRHGEAGRARVLAHFSLDAMARRYAEMYEELLAGP